MRVNNWTSIIIVSFVFALFSLFLMGCTTLSGLFRSRDTDLEEKREYAYDPVPRIMELEYLDFIEKVRKEQWDSIHVVDFGQPYSFSYPNSLADSIIEYAKLFLSVPYVKAGKGPDKFDCSGFTSYVFRHFGYELRASSNGQLNDGWKMIAKRDELKRGDLVFFGGRKKTREIGHVGIVVSNDPVHHRFSFIHASVRLGVTISYSTEAYYAPRYITACRILPE